jgi:8-oxo-dGTP diphosphatase
MESSYDSRSFPPFAVTVDLAVFTIRDGRLKVLLIERGEPPFEGAWALPGGFVRSDESLREAASRELAEETGLTEFSGHIEQLRSYGAPDRDPRMRVVSVAHLAFAPDLPEPVAGTDARRARWWSMDDVDRSLAFDHTEILGDAVDRVAAKLEYTSLATRFCPTEFTLGELQHVYEAVWGVPLPDRANFRRKVLRASGFVRPVDRDEHRLTGGLGRPAQLFRAGGSTDLSPPITRPPGARSARLPSRAT